jgi:hypothetical protein
LLGKPLLEYCCFGYCTMHIGLSPYKDKHGNKGVSALVSYS